MNIKEMDNGFKILSEEIVGNSLLIELNYNDSVRFRVFTDLERNFQAMLFNEPGQTGLVPRTLGKALLFNGDKKAFIIILDILQFAEEARENKNEN